jgi:PleD family two-component response regulator
MPARTRETAAVPDAPVALTPRRILVLEDNPDVAEALGTALALDGHTIEIAQDGPAALAMRHAFQPDVVLGSQTTTRSHDGPRARADRRPARSPRARGAWSHGSP